MIKKKIEKLCIEYVVNVILCTVILVIGGLVKDSVVMKGAASVSTMLAAWMVVFVMWRRRNKPANYSIYEEYSREHYAEFKRQLSRDVTDLKNEALDRGYEIEIQEKCDEEEAYSLLTAIPVFRATLDEAIETWDKSEEAHLISALKTPNMLLAIKVRRLTEEEKMQRKLLKEMGIEG